MKTFKLLSYCALSLAVAGCASIAGNNTRAVSVQSYPSGAQIYVDNQEFGKTPATVTLPSYIYGGKSITLKKPGYHDHTMMVNSQFQPIAMLDILCLPALLIDAATGNMVKIDPSNLSLKANLQRA